MKLSTRMRYGTRVMISLGAIYPTRASSVKELAEAQHLSEKYLEQIMAALKTAGLVTVARGIRGGYMLSRSPSSITLKDLYRGLEGSLSLVDCLDMPETCRYSDDCVTREVWNEMTESLGNVLERTTIQTLIERKKAKCGAEQEKRQH